MKCESYSEASDLWSMGMIIHMCLTGMTPWDGVSTKDIEQSILQKTSNQGSFDE